MVASDATAEIARAREWIDASERVTVLTGAGISTESGIPDFRGPQGLWTRNPEAEKMATIGHYMSDPEIRKRAWRDRLFHVAWTAEPNAGHRALVQLERRGKLHALLTQNVDGLHQKAGNHPSRVVEIHGTLREVMCMACEARWPMEHALERVRAGEEDPMCEKCGGILKSATISFGQGLVQRDLVRAHASASSCDVMLAVGTTLAVYPIAEVVPVAKQSGAKVVILNGSPTEMDELADAVIRGPIGELLPRLIGA